MSINNAEATMLFVSKKQELLKQQNLNNRIETIIREVDINGTYMSDREEFAQIIMDDPEVLEALRQCCQITGCRIYYTSLGSPWISFSFPAHINQAKWLRINRGCFFRKKAFLRKLRKFLKLPESPQTSDPTSRKTAELQKFCSEELDAAQNKLRTLLRRDEQKKETLFQALTRICAIQTTVKKMTLADVPGNAVLEKRLRTAISQTDDRISTLKEKLDALESSRKQIKVLVESACVQEEARRALSQCDNLEHEMEDTDIVAATLQAAYAEKRTCEDIVELLDQMREQNQPLALSVEQDLNVMKSPLPQNSALSTDSRCAKTLAAN